MTTATDKLLAAAERVLDDHEVQRAVFVSSEAQYKLQDLYKAAAECKSEQLQGSPERP